MGYWLACWTLDYKSMPIDGMALGIMAREFLTGVCCKSLMASAHTLARMENDKNSPVLQSCFA
jgi:hypothetical protein